MTLNIEQIEEKLTRRPQSPLFACLAAQYLDRQNTEKAHEVCLSGIDLYPSYSSAHYILAKVFSQEQHFGAALESIERALSINPTAVTFLKFRQEIKQKFQPETESPMESGPVVQPESIEQTESAQTDETPIDLIIGDIPPEKQNEVLAEQESELLEPDNVREASESISTDESPEQLYDQATTTELLTSEHLLSEPVEQTQATESDPEIIPEIGPDDQVNVEEHEINKIDELPEVSAEPEMQTMEATTLVEPSEAISVIHEEPISQPEYSAPLMVTGPTDTEETLPQEAQTADESDIVEQPVQMEEPTSVHLIDGGRIVSKTLAEIFASQGEYAEAITTYTLLKQIRPSLTEQIDARIAVLELLHQAKTGQG